MNKKNYRDETPILFFNAAEEDKQAYLALHASGISCKFYGPTWERTPLLVVGYQRYVGLREILKFIEERRKGGLS